MATPPAVLALIKAWRLTFSCSNERVAVVVYATMSVNGWRLVAVGDAVDSPGALQATEEIPVDGRNAGNGTCTFLYSPYADDTPSAGITPTSASAPARGAAPGRRLTVKVIPVGSRMLVTLQLVRTANGVAGPLEVLQLDVDRYTAGGAGAAGGGATDKGSGLREVPDLVHRLQGALDKAAWAGGGAGVSAAAAVGAAEASPSTASGTAAALDRAAGGSSSGVSGREGPSLPSPPPPSAQPLVDGQVPLLIQWGPATSSPLPEDNMAVGGYLPAGVPQPQLGSGPATAIPMPKGGMHAEPEQPLFSGQLPPVGPDRPGAPGDDRWDLRASSAAAGLGGCGLQAFHRTRTVFSAIAV